MSEGNHEVHPSLKEEVVGVRRDLRRLLLRLSRRLRPAAPIVAPNAAPSEPLHHRVLRLLLRSVARLALALVGLGTLLCWGGAALRLHAAADHRLEGLGQDLVFLFGTLLAVAVITLVTDWHPRLIGRVLLALAGVLVAWYGFPVVQAALQSL